MADPGERRGELDAVLEVVAAEARAFLSRLDDDPVQPAGSEDPPSPSVARFPRRATAPLAAVSELARLGRAAATRSAGPASSTS